MITTYKIVGTIPLSIHVGVYMPGEEVAIKLESVKSKHPQLLRETKIYRSLNGIGRRESIVML